TSKCKRSHAQSQRSRECARSGEMVPALAAASAKCTKPCNDEVSPRIVGKRSSINNVTVGMTILLPMEYSMMGSTFHGTRGVRSQQTSKFTTATQNIKP